MENETVKELLELQKLKSEFDFLLIQLRSEMKKREPIINLNFARKYMSTGLFPYVVKPKRGRKAKK